MKTNRQEYVTFLCPGTMFDEQQSKPIASRDTAEAVRMAAGITERYGAKPYGFYFETRIEPGKVRDSEGNEFETIPKITGKTGVHYINGKLRTYDDVLKSGDSSERILLGNMRNDGWEIVCQTTNSYKHTGIFGESDIIVDADGTIVERGNDKKHVEYRDSVRKRIARERRINA